MSWSEGDGTLPYFCENEDCPRYGVTVGVKRGTTADCPGCGWSLLAR